MLDIDNFSHAVAGIYDASMDIERWPGVLAQFAGMFGGTASQIGVGSSLQDIAFVKIWGVPEDVLAQTMPKYIALSPTDPRMRMLTTTYKATHCRQFLSDEELWASEMYKQALKPSGVEYCMGFTLPIDQDITVILGVMRGPHLAPFTANECTEFGRFAPHVTRAISMHGAFRRTHEELTTVKALLDGVPLGLMVVEEDELKVANRAARAILEDGDALLLRNGRLSGATGRTDAELRAAVNEALSDSDKQIGVTLPTDHAEPIRGLVRKLHPRSAQFIGAASESVALYLTDPRRPMETPEETLQRLFGLTPREATVVRSLAKGEDLQTTAAQLGISIQTARTHLKHIMETIGVSRQAELIHMVLSSPAWIAGGEPSP